MKKSILIISIGLFGFIINLNAQNKTEKPVLSNGSTIKVEQNNTILDNKDQQVELKNESKKTAKVLKKKESDSKKSNTSTTPQLGTMGKKEEK